MLVRVMDVPFLAKGDGITNDRESIQRAIDFIYAEGGGTVVLNEGRTFLSSGIVIRSNVELMFGDGAVLQQISGADGYVRPTADGYEPYTPMAGHNYSETVKWSHCWYKNYPFVFAPEGSSGFRICGNGVIRMSDTADGADLIKICPVGFYRVRDFEISDITITNYHSYAMMPFSSENGLFRNLKINNSCYGNGDGICLMNCRNIRITGCKMYTGDDSVYIFSSCEDPRRSEWWNSDEPQPSENIEIDHNDLESNHCKAFGMILWGLNCGDPEKVEVRNVYVHDNKFKTMGNWLWCPYTDKQGYPPVTGIRFENNEVEAIEVNFFETVVSDMTGYRSQTAFHNASFRDGRVFWNTDGEMSVVRGGEKPHGTVSGGSLFQGVWLNSGKPLLFRADVRTENSAKLFVRNSDTGENVAEAAVDNKEWASVNLRFTLAESGNYRLGISAENGKAAVTNAEIAGNMENETGYSSIFDDNGKVLFVMEK